VNDRLFTDDDDPFWNEPAPREPEKAKRDRIHGPFYQCSEPWAERAAEFTGQYLILALRLYRRWMMRWPPGSEWVTASSATLGMDPESRNARMRLLARLETAGLIEVARKSGQAPRVRVIDPQLRP
jgi:hypothetical protein